MTRKVLSPMGEDEFMRVTLGKVGDRVGRLLLVSIEPTGVVFDHDGSELRRRVGALP